MQHVAYAYHINVFPNNWEYVDEDWYRRDDGRYYVEGPLSVGTCEAINRIKGTCDRPWHSANLSESDAKDCLASLKEGSDSEPRAVTGHLRCVFLDPALEAEIEEMVLGSGEYRR